MNRLVEITIASLLFLSLLATPSVSGGTKEQEAIHITSNHMEALDREGKVIFSGDVKAQKGDLTIYAQKLTVFYGKKKKGKGQKSLKRLVAQGDVRIVQGQKSASSEKAVYEKDREMIVLTGNAKVWQGKNVVTGERITVYLNEDKSIVESGAGKRVKAVVYTSGK